jgi:hypothetical protein
MAEPLTVHIDDDTETIRVDPTTGNVERDQPDGGVVVAFGGARKQQKDDDGDDWFENLADEIDTQTLAKIANTLHEQIQADDTSRSGYLATRSRGLALMGLKVQDENDSLAAGSIEGQSKVVNPLLCEAVLRSWANAEAEFLPANGPVKIRDDGEETVAEDDLAESLERDMNHWFTVTASEYYPDTSHMLLWGPIFGGSGFKKVYRCPMRRRPVSESVDAKDLIVSDTTKDFRACARITHQSLMRPSLMRRMKFIGAYRDIPTTQAPAPTPNAVDQRIAGIQGTSPQHETRPEDNPYTIWETQCELDLDEFVPPGPLKGQGIPLPYLVTMDKDSQEILALRRDWDEDDPDCERKRMYVKYPYIPGPGFYGTGLLNVLGNSSIAMTAAWREALDAGMYASFPGGLISKLAARQDSMNLRVNPGEFRPIETGNLPITSVVMPNPYRDPSPGLMAMIDKILAQAKSAGAAIDIPTQEGVANVPVGTMLAQVEQATKVMAAAHKMMHAAQSMEFELIFDLFRAHPEDFWRSNKLKDAQGYWNEQKFLQALEDCNLVPQSDPNVPSHMHRMAKSIALGQLATNPVFMPYTNAKEAYLRILRAIREDPQGLVIDPQPQAQAPDPKLLEAQAKAQKAQSDAQVAQAKASMLPLQLQVDQQKLVTERQIHADEIERERIIHAGDMAKMGQDLEISRRQHQLDSVKTLADIQQQKHQQGMDMLKAHADMVGQQRQHALDASQFGLDVAAAQHQQGMERGGFVHDVHKAHREHSLNVAGHQLEREQFEHEQDMAHKEHELAKKVANKPKPKSDNNKA